MTTANGKVIELSRGDPQAALERLNRITGLSFARWPESLVPASGHPQKRVQEPVVGAMQVGGRPA